MTVVDYFYRVCAADRAVDCSARQSVEAHRYPEGSLGWSRRGLLGVLSPLDRAVDRHFNHACDEIEKSAR